MMLYVPAYTHERRPYSDSLYPTSFNLDSLPALTICAQRKTYGWCFIPDPMVYVGFCVTVYFGTGGEEDLLGNRWTYGWAQKLLLEQY